MSAGIYRKQYEALAQFADGLSITFDTPEGSFNEKFCELCRLIIADLGGTFTPVTGGTFVTRKASYLRQVAVAVGITTTEAGTTFRETFLKAAKSIWDNGNDATAPDFGASLDWRVYQYLAHSVGFNPLQWLYDSSLEDKTTPAYDANRVDSNCVVLDGAADYFSVADNALFDFITNESDFSFSGWFYYTGDQAEFQGLFSKSDTSASYTADGYNAVIGKTGATEDILAFQIRRQGAYTRRGIATKLVDATWYYATVTYKYSSDTVKIYLNGVEMTYASGLAPSPPISHNLVFGDTGGRDLFFNGKMAGWTVYNKELTLADIQTLYAGGSADGLIASYPMAGGLGMGLNEPDVSGNGNDGTWVTADLPSLRSGLQPNFHWNAEKGASKVLSFDGTAHASAANTGLGSGDFYYEICLRIPSILSNNVLFSDGAAFAGGIRAAVQLFSGGNTAVFYLDDNVTLVSESLGVSISAGDLITVKFSRVGSTCTQFVRNETTSAEYTDTFTASTDYSSSQLLSVGAWWNQSSSVWADFGHQEFMFFLSGTSAAEITHSYYSKDAYRDATNTLIIPTPPEPTTQPEPT